jgi:magnesium transporter
MPTAETDIQKVLVNVRDALVRENLDEAANILLELHPADQADVFDLLELVERRQLLPQLAATDAADLIEMLEEDSAVAATGHMSVDRLADVLDEMEPDDAADLLGDMPEDRASKALEQMEDAAEVRALLAYEDESAGGLMTTSYLAVRRQASVAEAIEFLRQVPRDHQVPYYLYVIDENDHLVGVLSLR